MKVGQYENFDQFEEDVQLTFTNCLLYNGTESDVSKMAIAVRELFESKLRDAKHKLTAGKRSLRVRLLT